MRIAGNGASRSNTRLGGGRQGSSTRGSGSSSPGNSSVPHYSVISVIGKGSFGVVYKAGVRSTGDVVAIKKVLQDPRYKNRELRIIKMLKHPNVCELKASFYERTEGKVWLNIVMEYVPTTLHGQLKSFVSKKKAMPVNLVRVYMYQISRALAYIHSLGVCHRDIKPHNLLLDPRSHVCKLIDFGSAKTLVQGQPNVAYICSRYYRAPELVFNATEYTTAIDVWSMGCVMAELFLGRPIFMGQGRDEQGVEIMKILGSPTRAQLRQMNPKFKAIKFAQMKGLPFTRVFRGKSPVSGIELMSQVFKYEPTKRVTAFRALAHPFFDELRKPDFKIDGRTPTPPPLFNFTEAERKQAESLNIWGALQPQASKKM